MTSLKQLHNSIIKIFCSKDHTKPMKTNTRNEDISHELTRQFNSECKMREPKLEEKAKISQETNEQFNRPATAE